MRTSEETVSALKQREWLLYDVIPMMLDRFLHELKHSQDLITGQSKADSLPLSHNDTIKGFLSLHGFYINKAELSIKLPHQEAQMKASIVASAPYFLEQLQRAHNYLSLAIDQVEGFSKPSDNQVTIELLEDLYKYVNHALHAFDYPNEASLFPYKVCHPKFFQPPLKQDTVIEFCVQDVFIACNIYTLDYSHTKHNNKLDKNNSIVTYKDKQVLIVDQIKTQTQSAMLTELKRSLKLMLELCQTHKQMLLQAK
ncbi:hypothetical protein BCV71DRAFT_288008 [Rhizopus microsporus]|uniref:RAVE subunit 2/Rogdi n=1 Tax=Rhizopus microsporus TaxID=58291 RepID=A0A1X0SEF3_RHIZD|nr:hypothetical protein BCV71DRAFT_288008 [Rhizopus microsporus]